MDFGDSERRRAVEALPKSARLSPTSITACARGTVLSRLGYEPVHDKKTLERFSAGNEIHKSVQDSLQSANLLAQPEAKVFSEAPPIVGKHDGVMLVGWSPVVLEIKSTSDKKVKKPNPGHVQQATMYMGMMRIRDAALCYYSKPTDSYTIFHLRYDNNLARAVTERAWFLLWCIEQRFLPTPECYSCQNPACFDYKILDREGFRG